MALRSSPDRIRNPDEVYRAGEPLPMRDPMIEKIAWIMDGAIPIGGRFSIGLDSVLGLVPGLGDVIGALIGMVIVLRAMQAGIPRVAIARMTTNIAIDTLIGSIPILGDVFDVIYKSNIKNLRIYEEAVASGRQSAARHWGFFAALLIGVAAVVAGVAAGIMALLR